MPPKKTESVYRILLKDAAIITWKNKFLWIFGFFLALSGQSGLYDVLMRNWGTWLGRGLAFMGGPVPWPSMQGADWSLRALPPGIIMVGVLVIALIALAIFLAVTSVGGVVAATRRIVKGLKVDFKSSWHIGLVNFWPLLAIAVLTYLLLNLAFVVVTWPAVVVATQTTGVSILVFTAAYAVYLPLLLAIAFVGLYAACGVVLGGLTVAEAIANGWRLLKKNIVLSVEMGLALFLTSFIFSLLVLTASIILLFPLFLASLIAYLTGALATTGALMGLAGALFALIIVMAGSYVTAFQVVAWTLLYERVTERKLMPKLVRILRAFPSYFAPKSR